MACTGLTKVLRATDACTEEMGGLGSFVYVFLKSDLASEPVATDDTYAALTFKEGKGAYRLDCKSDVNKITSEGQGGMKGFKLTGAFTIDKLNSAVNKVLRAINNGQVGFVYPDGDKFQILYDPNEPVRFESGGITTDTGAAQTDDRTSVVTPILNRQVYPNMWVTGPITEAPAV